MKRRTREPRPDVAPEGAAPEVTADDQARSGLFGLQVSAPPADLVTSDRLKGVRFDLAQPRGYYTEQVDTLVKLLTSSLAWHEEALYQRDQGIHLLQTDLDAATQQEATLRAQVEVFRVQGSVTVGEDGQILRKSQVAAANNALADANGAAAAVDQRLAASIEEVRSLREWADIVIPQTAQIAEVARVTQEQLEAAVLELAVDREQSADLIAQVAGLKSQVAALKSQAADTEHTVNLDDPELPQGVGLARARYDREYIPAKPGDPLLVDRRSPLTVWAPELFPEHEVGFAAEPTTSAPVQDDQWGDPLDMAVDVNPSPVPIQHGEAAPSDVGDGVARPQLRRQV